jgi:hypothetical protein
VIPTARFWDPKDLATRSTWIQVDRVGTGPRGARPYPPGPVGLTARFVDLKTLATRSTWIQVDRVEGVFTATGVVNHRRNRTSTGVVNHRRNRTSTGVVNHRRNRTSTGVVNHRRIRTSTGVADQRARGSRNTSLRNPG